MAYAKDVFVRCDACGAEVHEDHVRVAGDRVLCGVCAGKDGEGQGRG